MRSNWFPLASSTGKNTQKSSLFYEKYRNAKLKKLIVSKNLRKLLTTSWVVRSAKSDFQQYLSIQSVPVLLSWGIGIWGISLPRNLHNGSQPSLKGVRKTVFFEFHFTVSEPLAYIPDQEVFFRDIFNNILIMVLVKFLQFLFFWSNFGQIVLYEIRFWKYALVKFSVKGF